VSRMYVTLDLSQFVGSSTRSAILTASANRAAAHQKVHWRTVEPH
jgi:hypothetical protein